jgi:LPXTG-motif cell wall-anchored protein
VEDWVSAVEERRNEAGEKITILKLTLPDDIPLTITYKTNVNAAPGDPVNFSNVAHWEGYSAPTSSTVKVEDFSYQVGGKVNVVMKPSVKVLKMDQDDTSKYLNGATFTLQEVTYNEETGEFIPATDTIWEGTTGEDGEDGVLIFGKKDGQTMEYNKIYCLKETKAPVGYALDVTPHYFVVAEQANDGTWPEFPLEVEAYYLGAQYTCQVYDAFSTYELPSTGDTGTDSYTTTGIFLTITAMVVLAVQNKKTARKAKNK